MDVVFLLLKTLYEDPQRRMFAVDNRVETPVPCFGLVVRSHRIIQGSFPHIPELDGKSRVRASIWSSSADVVVFEVVEKGFEDWW